MIIQIIYLTVLFIDTVKSLVLAGKKGLSSQNYFMVYLLVSLCLELYGHYKVYVGEFNFAYLFNYYSIFLIVFFYRYYVMIFPKKFEKISLAVLMVMLGYIGLFTKFYGSDYENQLGILVCFYFIINALMWFYMRLKNLDEKRITNDPHFWVSCGLIFWSIFFIFRSVPMFFLKDNDPEFLNVLRMIQYCANIIMYGSFYIALKKFEQYNKGKIRI
ncbi:MAG: hypothetical protein LBE92_07930 [Chryseobacterium sp.]|jgi:hypothetical protein|uniref:hypothetical protein n=1 Tax=Chryseobacterium sp. TaxID=1871047 RepID=UPI00281AB6D9|nr:hypothetical protein [Chryseobacterium sp.]MDR2236036.1 hypothetical protein [Chryseobacterium sp.]